MSLKELNKFSSDKKFIASKKMGQNFLINNEIKNKIVQSANLNTKDVVLEIGPGTGAITSILLTNKIQLIAFELDKRLYELLSNKFSSYNNFHLFNVDALKIDWDEKIKNFSEKPIKLVANLPYSISSLLVLKILKTNLVDEAVIMVQKEMAERLSAKIKTHSYNSFSALIQLFFNTEKLFDVGKNNFSPKPNVTSSVIKLTKIKELNNYSFDEFDNINKFLKLIFQNKRKTILNNLSNHYDKQKIIKFFEENNFSKSSRAEELNPQELVKLMKVLND